MALAEMAASETAALELTNVSKRYSDLQVLQGLDLHVASGEVYGFLGRNGAGKSTALRIIMGITGADSGEIRLHGQLVRGNDPVPRQQIGYVAQEQHFYGWMTAPRIGDFVSGFYPGWDEQEFRRLLHALEVPLQRRIDGYSGGMNTKLALCLALATRPRLLLLDEPTAGMDAVARREFIDIVKDDAARSRRTTLFSSHLIDEVELAADKVGILDEGAMRFEGSLTALQQSVQRFIGVAIGQEQERELPISSGTVLRDETRSGRREIVLQSALEQTDADAAAMRASGWNVEQPSLEDIFVAMVGKRLAV